MTFDLNVIPSVEEEMVEEVATDAPLIGPWQTLSPSELASLYNMVQVPAHYQRVHHVVTHRANGTSEHAWIRWLPAHHASPAGTVIHSSEWSTMPSIFHAPPPLATARRPPPGQTPPDVTSAFSDPRSLDANLQQPAPSETTTEIGYHGDSEQSDNNTCSDKLTASESHHRHNIRRKKSMMERREPVQLEGGRKEGEPIAVEASKLPGGAENLQLSGENADLNLESENIGAELLDHLAREARRKVREAAFLAEFRFGTERCSPTAPCRRCMEFCEAPLPVDLVEAGGGGLGALYVDEDRPPVLKNMDEEEAAQRKGARHGPKSKSSEYRGVTYYKRTGRWESHIWHEGAQVYLGASTTKEEAARAYDKAAIMLGGPDVDINFEPESYQHEMSYLYKLSKEQLVIYLRRDSRGFGAQAAYPGVKHVKNHYQAVFGATLLGTFPTEEEAARVVYKAAVQDSCGTMASLIIDTHHVRNMPSFAAQRYAALYPEEVEAMMLNNQTKTSKKGGKSSSSSKKRSSPPTRQKPSSGSSPVTPSATASPGPVVEQLKASQVNETSPPAAKRNRSTWGEHLACRRAHKQIKAAAARNPPAMTVMPPASSSRRGCNTTSPGVAVSRISPSSATVLSGFSGIGQASTPSSVPACSVSSSSWKKRPMTSDTISAPAGPINFKLFNVEINVAEEKAAPGHGGQGNVRPPGAQNLNGVDARDGPVVTEEDQFDKLLLPRKRCKTTGECCPYLPHTLATQMASGLSNVVAINRRLHEILAETAPQRPRTGEVRNARFTNRNNYHNPNCMCHD